MQKNMETVNIKATWKKLIAPNTSLTLEEALKLIPLKLTHTAKDTIALLKDVAKQYGKYNPCIECGRAVPQGKEPMVTSTKTGDKVVMCWDCAYKIKEKYGNEPKKG